MLGNEILEHSLWWHGPQWLRFEADKWPCRDTCLPPSAPLEERVIALQCSKPQDSWDLAERYSSWPKLIRITAYLIKFVSLCRRARSGHKMLSTSVSPTLPPAPASSGLSLSASHCNLAKTFWIKRIQADSFPTDINAMSNNKSLSPRSALLSLNPFLDKDGIVRVGGRLNRAPVPFSVRHPILLSSHPLVTLIVNQAHLRALHAGPQLTLSILRRDFWILRARTLVKAVIHRCVVCTRERNAIPTQIMGDLPEARVSSAARSFLHSGLDYAGPIQIRASAGRGITSRKAYIALFICLATKAIHLELVGDYSTQAFLNAFSRFCARRGLPQAMYSDNGTTFVGADRELTLAYRSALHDPNFLNMTASDNVTWNFVPPSAPHFGGLWEAG
ncbi:PREDICTED: uncharacterized protein LOC105556814, partial [Vollenhovia emeryi]|uniref:uncharacterized protein LOC105556814 n=1 Tax=Vollenhovia emeryi TaxID=411798 RepID=UPI0005F45334